MTKDKQEDIKLDEVGLEAAAKVLCDNDPNASNYCWMKYHEKYIEVTAKTIRAYLTHTKPKEVSVEEIAKTIQAANINFTEDWCLHLAQQIEQLIERA